MPLFRNRETFDPERIPQHVAIILDGNGRWAKRRGLPRTAGHAAGAENFRTIATFCMDIGIKYLTVYAFSTENWKRPENEVSALWELLRKYLEESILKMEKDRVKIHIMGDAGRMPKDIIGLIDKTREISGRFDGIQLNICLNYGGRNEILRAVKLIASECMSGNLAPEELTEDDISSRLYSAGIPDPDLIIRSGGEMRISNFLLWQSAYSEFYVTDTLWPDFDKKEMIKAISSYQKRDRRFGGVK